MGEGLFRKRLSKDNLSGGEFSGHIDANRFSSKLIIHDPKNQIISENQLNVGKIYQTASIKNGKVSYSDRMELVKDLCSKFLEMKVIEGPLIGEKKIIDLADYGVIPYKHNPSKHGIDGEMWNANNYLIFSD